MSEVHNPYAPPLAPLHRQPEGGFWRNGKLLILKPGSLLPERCVKCNAPARTPIQPRKMFWHHPALYVLILPGLLIYAIVALLVRKQISINIGLCPTHFKRRLYGILLAWGGSILGFALTIFGMSCDSCGLGVLGVVLSLGAIVGGMLLSRTLYPVLIKDDIAHFKGCGEPFLASLPEFRP